ncbi:MAG: transporter [Myxococcaceae bacterium]|nr:transporter [Myxococcaceae bacterium]
MADSTSNDPLHGLTLEAIVTRLVEHYGFQTLGELVPIHCFQYEPSIRSSLKFLRRMPWARSKVEALYLATDDWPEP